MFKKQTTTGKVTTELNQHLDSSVSLIAVERHLHKQNIYNRAALTKPLIAEFNATRRLQRCPTHKTWYIVKWKNVIWSDESSFTLFLTTGWGTFGRHLIVFHPTIKHKGESVILWQP
ncbi:transposable element Tc1 transposase [Trichonephila clavipes]|nr:transposable element Tc1 transposase [Trichonephila clavipes]